MVSYTEKYQNLLKEFFLSSFYKRYLELSSKKELSLSQKKELNYIIHSKKFQMLSKNLSNIHNIEDPVSNDFFDKITFIKSSSIHPHTLVATSKERFSDGSSIFLWYSALVDYYKKKEKIDESIEKAIIDLYKYSLGEESFQNRFFLLQFALKMDKDSFCSFLGILPYLYKQVSLLTCDSKIIDKIIKQLSSVDLSSYTSIQLSLFQTFLSSLSEVKDKVENIAKDKKEVFGEAVTQSKIEEILKYLQNNKVSMIPSTVSFSDGIKMASWLNRLLSMNANQMVKQDIREFIQESVYQIVLALYNKETTPLHDGIDIDYGSSLKRVVTYFGFNSFYLFFHLQIPTNLLVKIMENKIVPTEEFIVRILSFLKTLSCENRYQKELVKQAITIYEELKKMSLAGDIVSFHIYSGDRETEFLQYWEEFDSSVLAKARRQNYDWYMKCLTYFFICKSSNKRPLLDDYFYDGTIVYKWIQTQNRYLNGKGSFEFTEEQFTMLEVVQNILKIIDLAKNKKVNIDSLVFSHFDTFMTKFEESFTKFGEISQDVELYGFSLLDSWKYVCLQLKNEKVFFTNDQIEKIKNLRRKIIYKSKEEMKTSGSINFGYEFFCFMDGLHLSIDKVSKMFSISRGAAANYSMNKNVPRLNTVEDMLTILNQLNLSSYRLDQKKDIERFKQVLSSLKEYYIMRKEITLSKEVFKNYKSSISVTGNLEKDIPVSVLKEIRDSDIRWYREFQKLFMLIYERNSDDSKEYVHLSSCSWFTREMYNVLTGDTTSLKKELLYYLNTLNQKILLNRKNRLFVTRFAALESFVYENKRIPNRGEICLGGNIDGSLFYTQIRHDFYGDKDYYANLSTYFQEQIKVIMQYLALCQREKFGYSKDRVENKKLYVGERLNHIRICLGLSMKDFSDRLGWDTNVMFQLYGNKRALNDTEILSLLHLFKEMKNLLREDQVKEVQDFINVLINRELDDTFALKFCKKTNNDRN